MILQNVGGTKIRRALLYRGVLVCGSAGAPTSIAAAKVYGCQMFAFFQTESL